jgi:hypothetical protein
MADKQKASPLSIAVPKIPVFEDEATAKARADYEKALQEVLATVEKRKNRLIEPTWAAIARGLQNSSRFSEGFESARKEQQAEDELYAQQKLALAQAQMQMAGQGAQVRALRERFGIGGSQAPQVAPQGAPQGAPQPSAPQAGMPPSVAPVAPVVPSASVAPALREDVSGLPGAMSFEQFARMQLQEGITSESEIRKNWANYVKEMRTQVGDTTRMPGAAPMVDITARVDVYVPEAGGTLNMSVTDSMALDAARGNPTERQRVLDRIMMRERGTTPVGVPAQQPRPKTKEELAAEQKGREQFATTKAGEAGKQEFGLPEKYQQALMMSNTAQQTANLVAESPDVFGQLRAPGVASAIGRLIQEGIRAGNTTISLGGFEDAVRQANPNIKQADLDNLMMVAGNLAELELIYTNLYLRGGGQITEGEREIVRRVVGSPALSPKFLIVKSEILKTRSDQDIALYDAYQRARENNPGIQYNEWLNGQQARGILQQYDRRFKALMGLVPPRGQAAKPAPSAARPTPGASRPSPEQGVTVPEAMPSGGAVLGRRAI